MRYEIRIGSQSGHCCFGATVVDTTRRRMLNGQIVKDEHGDYQYVAVCECLDLVHAQRICNALDDEIARAFKDTSDAN